MQNEKHSPEASQPEPVGGADLRQLLSVIGGPLALLEGLQAKYIVSQLWACGSLTATVVNHVVALATLLLALGAAMLARGQWRHAGTEAPGDHDGLEGRTRTIAAVGLGMSLLSAVVIFAQWMPQLVLDPCFQ